jgi:hypothetical protein
MVGIVNSLRARCAFAPARAGSCCRLSVPRRSLFHPVCAAAGLFAAPRGPLLPEACAVNCWWRIRVARMHLPLVTAPLVFARTGLIVACCRQTTFRMCIFMPKALPAMIFLRGLADSRLVVSLLSSSSICTRFGSCNVFLTTIETRIDRVLRDSCAGKRHAAAKTEKYAPRQKSRTRGVQDALWFSLRPSLRKIFLTYPIPSMSLSTSSRVL